MQKHVENFLLECKDLIAPNEFEPIASKILELQNKLSLKEDECSSLKIFLREQTVELKKDRNHVFTHIKAVVDRINKDLEDGKIIEQSKEAIDGKQNVATEQTAQSDEEKVGNLNDEIADSDAKKRKRRPTNGKSLKKDSVFAALEHEGGFCLLEILFLHLVIKAITYAATLTIAGKF